jgi:tRNA threonylcarbamoyladenosine biosynthesis protein TsaB
MSLILSIETATRVCSVAVHEDERLLSSQELFVDRSHSEYLGVMIKDLLNYSGKTVDDLSAIAVSKGPGSYTGLRIGVSTAKGLCFGLDIPLVAVNSLLAMASETKRYNISEFDLCPMLDARRMEVYCLITDHELRIKQDTQARIIDESSFVKELSEGKLLFFGNGMTKSREILSRNPNAFFINDMYPKASSIGFLAYDKYKKQEFENTETFEPFYLKDFIATTPKKIF